MDWQMKAFQTHQTFSSNASPLRPQTVFCQNMGRFKYFVGAHAEAHIWCQVAINLLAGSENWAMQPISCGENVNRAESDFEEAQAKFLRAQRVWLKGSQMPNHHLIGACLYKIGCAALDAGHVGFRVKGIWKSLLRLQHWISMFCKGTTQECCLYKLSVALSSCGFDDGEAEQRMKEAQAIAWTCLGLKKDAAFVNEERTFDGLVYI
ncbi:hypothetical protein NHJ6243_007053 [Beauveria neobassiana]